MMETQESKLLISFFFTLWKYAVCMTLVIPPVIQFTVDGQQRGDQG